MGSRHQTGRNQALMITGLPQAKLTMQFAARQNLMAKTI